jgi:hypothetical protein
MKNFRKWSEMENDEIFAIWRQFLKSEGLQNYDPLGLDNIPSRPMRITPMEMIKLVDELCNRLEIKENA